MKRLVTSLMLLIAVVYTITMPTFAIAEFSDIGINEWYQGYANYAADLGLITEVGDGVWGPDGFVTRAEMMTIMGRLYELMTGGKMKADGISVFSDVDSSHEHATAIFWGYNSGIIKGYPDGSFKPNDFINRESFAVIIVRYLDYIGREITQSVEGMCSENPSLVEIKREEYADKASISSWASENVEYLSDYGIMIGADVYDAEKKALVREFLPNVCITRAETAAAISRLYQSVMFTEDMGSCKGVISFNYIGMPGNYGNMEAHRFLSDREWVVLSDYASYEMLLRQVNEFFAQNTAAQYNPLATPLDESYFSDSNLLIIESQRENIHLGINKVCLTDIVVSEENATVTFFSDSHGYTADVSGYIFFIQVPKTVTNVNIYWNSCVHQASWPFI